MNQGDKVIFVYAIVPAEKAGEIKFPEGTMGKASEPCAVEDFIEPDISKRWGAIVSHALIRTASRICPDVKRSAIIRGLS